MPDPTPVIACLSAYDEPLVRRLAGTDDVLVRVASRTGDAAEAATLIADADVVIADAARHYLLDAAAIDAMRRCRFIQQPAVGYDSVDVARAAQRGIPVANAPAYNADAVADWVIMATLAVLRGAVTADADLRRGQWPALPLGRELGALTVGLVGLGAVGNAVAARLRGFGSTIIGVTRSPREGVRAAGLHEVLAVADVVSLHLPLTPQTRGLIGVAELARMKDGAVLVNSARGGLVDQAALVDGLRRGRPAAAALDVFDPEPLPPDSPLLGLPNVFVSPHIAGSTEQARARVRQLVGENLRRVLRGEPALHVVN